MSPTSAEAVATAAASFAASPAADRVSTPLLQVLVDAWRLVSDEDQLQWRIFCARFTVSGGVLDKEAFALLPIHRFIASSTPSNVALTSFPDVRNVCGTLQGGVSVWVAPPRLTCAAAHLLAAGRAGQEEGHGCAFVNLGDIPAAFEVVINKPWGSVKTTVNGVNDVLVWHGLLKPTSVLGTRDAYKDAYENLFRGATMCYIRGSGEAYDDGDSPSLDATPVPYVYEAEAYGPTPAPEPYPTAEAVDSGGSTISSVTISLEGAGPGRAGSVKRALCPELAKVAYIGCTSDADAGPDAEAAGLLGPAS